MASLELKLIVDAETGIAKIRSFGEAAADSAKKQQTAWEEVGSALKTLATVYVFDKAVEFLKSSVEEYANAEKAATKLEAVLNATHGAAGLSAQAMKDYAAQLQETTTFEDDTIVNAEAMLATFTKINNPDVFKQAMASALDLSTTMGGDLQGAVLKVGKALDDPAQGLKALRLSGISFTESQVDLIKKLQDSGDILGAQKIILGEVESRMGGAAEAAGKTFAGQMERLKNETGNAKEALGGLIAQGLAPFIPKLTEAAQGVALFFGNLVKGQEMSQTDRIGKQFAFITERIFEANKEVERLKGLYGDSAASVGAYHAAAKKVEMLEKQRAGILGQNAVLIKQNAEAEKKAAKEREDWLKADKESELWAKNTAARKEYADLAKKTMAEIGTEEDKLVKKYQLEVDQIKGSSKEANDARYALEQKLSQDLGAIWDKDAEKAAKKQEEDAKVLKDYADLAAQTMAGIGTEEDKLVQKHLLATGKITGDSAEANDARYALERELSQDLVNLWDKQTDKYKKMTSAQLVEIKQSAITAVEEKQKVVAELQLRDDNYLTYFKDNLAVSLGATKTFYEQMGELGTAFGAATKNTLAAAINDGIMGTPKTPEEYGKTLGGAMAAAFSTMAAETIMKKMALMYAELAATSSAAGTASGTAFSAGWWGAVIIAAAAAVTYWNQEIKAMNLQTQEYFTLKVTPELGDEFSWRGIFNPVYATAAGAGEMAGVYFSESFRDMLKDKVGTIFGQDSFLTTSFGGFLDVVGKVMAGASGAVEKFKIAVEEVSSGIGKWPAAIEEMTKIKNPLHTVTDAVQYLIDNGTKPFKVMSDAITAMADNLALLKMPDIPNPFTAMKHSIDEAVKSVQALIDKIGAIPGVGAIPGGSTGGGGGLGVSGSIPGVGGYSFADGGVMTGKGALPLTAYSVGGIADSPQVALFGEGRMPEAYVPLPNGRSIPVEITAPPAPRSGETSMPLMISIGAEKLENLIVDLAWTLSESGQLTIHPRAVRSYAQ